MDSRILLVEVQSFSCFVFRRELEMCQWVSCLTVQETKENNTNAFDALIVLICFLFVVVFCGSPRNMELWHRKHKYTEGNRHCERKKCVTSRNQAMALQMRKWKSRTWRTKHESIANTMHVTKHFLVIVDALFPPLSVSPLSYRITHGRNYICENKFFNNKKWFMCNVYLYYLVSFVCSTARCVSVRKTLFFGFRQRLCVFSTLNVRNN